MNNPKDLPELAHVKVKKTMPKMYIEPSLGERLRNAADEAEVDRLLEEGKGFKTASAKTRRHWNKTASVRIQALKKEKKGNG